MLDLLSQQKTLAHLHMEILEGTDPEPTPGMLTAHIFRRTAYEVHNMPYWQEHQGNLELKEYFRILPDSLW